jgi:hypothetical protein
VWALADLDEIRVAVEAQGFAAGWSDLLGRPYRFFEESDDGLADSFETGETIFDLGFELGVGGFVGLGWGEFDFDAVLLRDTGDVCAGCLAVTRDFYGADEAEIDDVAGEDGIVAVAESEEDVSFGEHLCR